MGFSLSCINENHSGTSESDGDLSAYHSLAMNYKIVFNCFICVRYVCKCDAHDLTCIQIFECPPEHYVEHRLAASSWHFGFIVTFITFSAPIYTMRTLSAMLCHYIEYTKFKYFRIISHIAASICSISFPFVISIWWANLQFM